MISTREIGGRTWFYRADTNDLGIIQQNFVDNANALPDEMAGWLVLDIGAHIGSMAVLAAVRGARVSAYEPASENYKLLVKNVASLCITCRNVGVGDPTVTRLFLDTYNSGLHSTFLINGLIPERFETVAFIPLPEALDRVCWDFVKIDIEGSEYVLLEELIKRREQVVRLCISFHEVPGCSAGESIDALRRVYESAVPLGGESWLFQ